MDKIKVLQVCYSLKAAGIETFVTNVQKSIDKEKFDVHFLIYKSSEKELFYKEIVEKNGGIIENASADDESIFILRHIKQRIAYYKIVRKGNYDVVHIHASSGLQGLEVLLARIAGVKKIFVHSHTSKLGSATKLNWLKKIIHKIGLRIINIYAVEKLACSEVAAKYLFPWSKEVIIINNGISCVDYKYDLSTRNRIREELGIKKNDFVVGHIGSFTEAKNHEFLLEVFNQLQSIRPEVQLMLIGDGPLKKFAIEKCNSLKLHNIHFMGIRSNCNELLMSMDCIVFPSFWEGLPIVIVEAQCSGLPCLLSNSITRQVDVSDLIIYYPLEKEASQWARQVLAMIKDRERSKYSDLLKKSEFDISNTVEQLQTLYKRD